MKYFFVGSLPFGANEKYVNSLFSPYGEVKSIEMHVDWSEPKDEPHAIVEVDTNQDEKIVDELDGIKIGQTHLRVHPKVNLKTLKKW